MTPSYQTFPDTRQNVADKQISVMEIPFSGLELVFIIIAFTVFCIFGLAAICTRSWRSDCQGESILIEQSKSQPKSRLKEKNRNSNQKDFQPGSFHKDKLFYL